jgi:flavin-dependent dehydrogenase
MLQKLARDAGKQFDTVIFERRDFGAFGSHGCNMCAGVVSSVFINSLAAMDIAIPEKVIQREIQGHCLETKAGGLRMAKDPGTVIYTVYRGVGPPGLEFDEERSFDFFLLRTAIEHGIRCVNAHVRSIRLSNDTRKGPVFVEYDEGTYEADLLVGAFGVNSELGRLFEQLGFGYKRPRTEKACLAEIPLPEDFVLKGCRDEIKVFALGIPGIRFGAITPKRRHVTVSLVGQDVSRVTLETFLMHPRVRAHFPDGWKLPRDYCMCFPKLPVSAARRPYHDRIVMVGDANISRYVKNGIESSLFTARSAALTVAEKGVTRSDFRRHSFRECRSRYYVDNAFGKILFALNDMISKYELLAHTHLFVAKKEQGLDPTRRGLNRILWNIFTGDAPYVEIFKKSMSPSLQLSLLGGLARAIWKRLLRSNRRNGDETTCTR